MHTFRRTLLKAFATGGLFIAMLTTGMLKSRPTQAADRNTSAFEARNLEAALMALGANNANESADLQLMAQDIAENGALVPVVVISNIPNTTSIAILVEKNPYPLSACFALANGAVPEISARLKLAQTTVVKAIAKADGQYYSAQREIKVTLSGCDD